MKEFGSNAEKQIFYLGRQLLNLDAELAGASQQKRLALFQEAITATINSLRSVPGFAGGKVLNELRLDLADVIAGRAALQPVPKSGRPKQGLRDSLLQAWAAAGVDLLISKGDNETVACEFLAKILTANGHKGRRSGSISASTVREWRSQASGRGDKEVAYFIRVQASLHLERSLPSECDLKLAREEVSRIIGGISCSDRVSD